MMIFKKLPDGTWEKSGEILPTEHYYTIAVDAEKIERMTYPCEHAIQEVENRIKQGTTAYRFELASPPASFRKAARRAANKTIKKILDNSEAPAKRKRTPKARHAGKATKETGKQRRARLKAARICTACGKRKAQARPESKGGGHYPECRTCRQYYAKWAGKKARKR